MRYTGITTRGEVKEILDRVLSWSDDDQAKIVRFVLELARIIRRMQADVA